MWHVGTEKNWCMVDHILKEAWSHISSSISKTWSRRPRAPPQGCLLQPAVTITRWYFHSLFQATSQPTICGVISSLTTMVTKTRVSLWATWPDTWLTKLVWKMSNSANQPLLINSLMHNETSLNEGRPHRKLRFSQTLHNKTRPETGSKCSTPRIARFTDSYRWFDTKRVTALVNSGSGLCPLPRFTCKKKMEENISYLFATKVTAIRLGGDEPTAAPQVSMAEGHTDNPGDRPRVWTALQYRNSLSPWSPRTVWQACRGKGFQQLLGRGMSLEIEGARMTREIEIEKIRTSVPDGSLLWFGCIQGSSDLS